jgi:hypothetical protein
MTSDSFNFKDIPGPSTPDEQRIVDLVRAVVRDELNKRDEAFFGIFAGAARTMKQRGKS